MRFAHILFTVATCVALSACAGFPPKPEELAKVPHIQFGQPLPKEGDYVLLFPAGTPLPVSMAVGGNIFEQEQQATLHVTLKRDVYAYRRFVSFDGTVWRPSNDLIDIRLELQIPQNDGSNAGIVRVKIDQNNDSTKSR